MWIFTRRFPAAHWIIAPRAPLPAPEGGYSWLPTTSGKWHSLDEFQPVCSQLLERLDSLFAQLHLPQQRSMSWDSARVGRWCTRFPFYIRNVSA